jgi:hypothetical protein
MSQNPNERMNAIEAAARRTALAIRESVWIAEHERTFMANAFDAIADEIAKATAPLSDDANERMSDKDRVRFDELFQEYVRHAHGVQGRHRDETRIGPDLRDREGYPHRA